jgi:hypothetical protein
MEDLESVCFEILGFDILIKEDFTPVLLEVNHSPSFCTETPLDLTIKKHLLLDTLNLLNLNRDDKTNYLKSRNEQDNIHNAQILKNYVRNAVRETEPEELGAFRPLYPPSSQSQETLKVYDQLLKCGRP